VCARVSLSLPPSPFLPPLLSLSRSLARYLSLPHGVYDCTVTVRASRKHGLFQCPHKYDINIALLESFGQPSLYHFKIIKWCNARPMSFQERLCRRIHVWVCVLCLCVCVHYICTCTDCDKHCMLDFPGREASKNVGSGEWPPSLSFKLCVSARACACVLPLSAPHHPLPLVGQVRDICGAAHSNCDASTSMEG